MSSPRDSNDRLTIRWSEASTLTPKRPADDTRAQVRELRPTLNDTRGGDEDRARKLPTSMPCGSPVPESRAHTATTGVGRTFNADR
ncbi:hypothetical protein QO003_001740 [Arthrobacter silviterrae]|nr:hypothetical protein [Arthrobacter silviterrae]MDQ0277437.1 hypothetical protein [Arthrobacter silviterrae]